jgi:ribosomal protein S18 acetylase RimI-like enzyme
MFMRTLPLSRPRARAVKGGGSFNSGQRSAPLDFFWVRAHSRRRHAVPDPFPVLVHSATIPDIRLVAKIAKMHAIGAKAPGQAKHEGFLVSVYSPETYRSWIRHLEVAEISGEVVGFTLAFFRDEVPPDLEDFDSLLSVTPDSSFLLIKQIAVKSGFERHGIGRSLYARLSVKFPELPMYAAILLEPENPRSIAFHEALGFRRFFEFCGNDKARRCFWRLDASGRNQFL